MVYRTDDPGASEAVSLDVVAKARTLLGAGFDPAGKTEEQIIKAAVARHLGESVTAGKSATYMRAALDVAVDMLKGPKAAAGVQTDGLDDASLRAARDRADAARDTFLLRLDGMWMSHAQRSSVAIGPRTYEEHCEYLSHLWRGQAAANAAVAKHRAGRAA